MQLKLLVPSLKSFIQEISENSRIGKFQMCLCIITSCSSKHYYDMNIYTGSKP